MQNPRHTDALLWLALSAMWSSSYIVIKVAVAETDPQVIVAGRMLVGSFVILSVLKLRSLSLSRRAFDWLCYSVTGLLGSTIPFLLITYGEQTVDSALASILMGVMPVVTLMLAAWLIPEETLTLRATIGVLGGVLGVAVLVGPAALGGLGQQFGAQAAILGATVCYACSTIFTRRFVKRPALEMAAGSMLVGTVVAWVIVFTSGVPTASLSPTLPSLGAVLYLGLVSTACANLIYFYLVPRLGATRMAQVNFAIPVFGLVLSVLLLGEDLTIQRVTALGIIIGSVYLGTTRGHPRVQNMITRAGHR